MHLFKALYLKEITIICFVEEMVPIFKLIPILRQLVAI